MLQNQDCTRYGSPNIELICTLPPKYLKRKTFILCKRLSGTQKKYRFAYTESNK